MEIDKLRQAHFEQLLSYLHWCEEQGFYYGNRKQFKKRHIEIRNWLLKIMKKKEIKEGKHEF